MQSRDQNSTSHVQGEDTQKMQRAGTGGDESMARNPYCPQCYSMRAGHECVKECSVPWPESPLSSLHLSEGSQHEAPDTSSTARAPHLCSASSLHNVHQNPGNTTEYIKQSRLFSLPWVYKQFRYQKIEDEESNFCCRFSWWNSSICTHWIQWTFPTVITTKCIGKGSWKWKSGSGSGNTLKTKPTIY